MLNQLKEQLISRGLIRNIARSHLAPLARTLTSDYSVDTKSYNHNKNSRERDSRLTNFHQQTRNMLISVDGNISSGKSTLVAKIVEHFTDNMKLKDDDGSKCAPEINGKSLPIELEILPEPLDKWCNLSGYNLLELFYQDPKKYNFVFQHYVQLTRLMDTVKSSTSTNVSNSTTKKIRVMERSLQNNRYCFLELARKSKQLDSAEFAVLAEWYNWLESNMDLHLDLVIYLRTNPDTAYSRMMNRGRIEESSCPISYLAALHETYEDWLIRTKSLENSQVKQQVIVLDANKSREEVAADCIEGLTRFIRNYKINGIDCASDFGQVTDKYITA